MAVHFISEQHQLCSLPPILMEGDRSWGVDTETTGLDAISDKVILLQIGNEEDQYVIDTRSVNPEPLRPFLESEKKVKILHNAKFDYKMVKTSFGIEMERMVDTFLGEKILNVGLKKSGYGLDDCLLARLGIEMDKEMQKSFIGHTGPFSQDQINYAAKDVEYLIPYARELRKEVVDLELGGTWNLESQCVPAFGDMELFGVLLDQEGWMKISKEKQELAEECREKMNDIAKGYFPEKLDLFGDIEFNYDSPPQIVELLNRMNIQYTDKDGELHAVDKSNDAILKQVKGDYPILKLLKQYRSHRKIVTTYGQNYIDAVHPDTGRIHAAFHQMGTETGRPAAGNLNVYDKKHSINLLNIPSRDALAKKLRNCFIAPKDYLIETDDYSGCELRILAHLSQDPGLVEPLVAGEDLHCAVASKLYRCEVTKSNENKHLRSPAKNLNFGRRW